MQLAYLHSEHSESLHMHKRMRIEGETSLVYDARTNGVIDTDREAYDRYLQKKQQRYQQLERVDRLETRINNIETGLTDIKLLLTRLLENQNGHNN